jgi:hypothetical protein
MAGKPGFFQYITSAFNARPFGMVVPPNWVGLAAAGLLGVLNPGFWVLGAGLELGYLLMVSSNERFRKNVDARAALGSRGDWDTRVARALAELDDADGRRYQAIAERCRSIIDLQTSSADSPPPGLETQQEGLGRLTWMYLRLLLARHTIAKVIGESSGSGASDLTKSMAAIERRLKTNQLTDEVRRSLEGQLEILRQRIDRRGDADRQLTFIDAELQRIEHQVELIREQAALATDPELLSQRIDEIAATLGGTSQWMRDQRQVLGAMEDLLSEPAPLPRTGAKESQ